MGLCKWTDFYFIYHFLFGTLHNGQNSIFYSHEKNIVSYGIQTQYFSVTTSQKVTSSTKVRTWYLLDPKGCGFEAQWRRQDINVSKVAYFVYCNFASCWNIDLGKFRGKLIEISLITY